MQDLENKLGRTPSRQFALDLIELYFNHAKEIDKIQNYIEGFKNQGLNMESFYWMDPECSATKEDLKIALKDPFYSLEKSEIERLVSKIED